MNNSIPFGKKDGKLYSPDEVSKGLDCGCVCPECNAKLIACKGNIRKHHFRHQALGYANCGQTAIHLMAKQMIAEEKRIVVPVPKRANYHIFDAFEEIKLEKAVLDSGDYEGIFPDIVGEYRGKKIFIEINICHKFDEQKKKKIRHTGISCLEINLSDSDDSESIPKYKIRKIIFKEHHRLKWIFNPFYDKRKNELKEEINQEKARIHREEEKKAINMERYYERKEKFKQIVKEKGIILRLSPSGTCRCRCTGRFIDPESICDGQKIDCFYGICIQDKSGNKIFKCAYGLGLSDQDISRFLDRFSPYAERKAKRLYAQYMNEKESDEFGQK